MSRRSRLPGPIVNQTTGNRNRYGGSRQRPDGWRRFYLGGAPDQDPHTQFDALVETGAYTQITSPSSVSITLSASDDHMQEGAIWHRPLRDEDGKILTWDKPFTLEWLIETKDASAVGYTKAYFGLGVTDEGTSADIQTAEVLGTVVNKTASATHKVRGFGCGGYGTSGASGDHDWSAHTILHVGPGHEHIGQLASVRANQFDPASPGVEASNTASSYICNLSNSCAIPGQGKVYIFATWGFIGSRASAYAHKFRIFYRVSRANSTWTPA